MTGVIPDTFTDASSFLDDEIEYLEFESLIDEVAERLEASWSYSMEDEAYQVEFIDEEGTLHEAVQITLEFCESGFNEGRDLIISSAFLADYDPAVHLHVLPEILTLANQLIFSRVQISADNQLQLVGKALYHQELASDVITTMVEEISSLASEFRLKLESSQPVSVLAD